MGVISRGEFTVAKIIDGKNGSNGNTTYLHKAWADSPDGKIGFSTTNSLGKKYLGIHSSFSKTPPKKSEEYNWTELSSAIEVGSVNLIDDSLGDFIFKPRTAGTEIDNSNYMKFDANMKSFNEYVFSAEVEKTHGTFSEVTVIFRSTDKANSVHNILVNAPIINGSIVAKMPSNTDGIDRDNILVYAGVSGKTRGNGMIMKKVKLEKGNKPTDWSPSINDMASKDEVKVVSEKLAKVEKTTDSITSEVSSIKKITEEKVDISTLNEIRDKNYGYPFKLEIEVGGDSDKYYPVIIKGGDQNVDRMIMVKRSYGQKAPNDWHTGSNASTHRGALTVEIKCNFGGWGGQEYNWELLSLKEVYSRPFAGCKNVGYDTMFAIFLRGGGATYTLYSDQPLDKTGIYDKHPDGGILPSPQIAYKEDLIMASTSHRAYAPKYRTLTEAVKKEIASKLNNTNRFNEISEHIEKEISKLTQTTSGFLAEVEKINKDKISKSELKLLSDEISGAVKTNKGYGGFKITDKGAILDAEKMYVGIDNQKGFQVVHKDNPTKPILGVSPSGKFEFNALNLDQRFEETNKKIDEIKIGGRNYWRLVSGFLHSYLEHDEKSNVFRNTVTQSAFAMFKMSKLKLELNNEYTLSFEIKPKVDGVKFNTKDLYINSKISTKHNAPTLLKGKWAKVYGTFNYNFENEDVVHIYLGNIAAVGNVEFRNFQIELGNKPTDWTPAPEDIEAQIDSIEIGGRNYLQTKREAYDIGTYQCFKFQSEEKDYILTVRDNNKNIDMSGIFIFTSLTPNPNDTGVRKEIMTNGVEKNRHINGRKELYFSIYPNSPEALKKVFDRYLIKIERGTKPTDWTPAPEDSKIYKAWASSDDGIKDFSRVRPELNLLDDIENKVYTRNGVARGEFINDNKWDLSSIVEANGVDDVYTISFDLKVSKAGRVKIYLQSGSGSKYNFSPEPNIHIDATTEWKRYSFTTKFVKSSQTITNALMAFYGVSYGSGIFPHIKNIKVEKGEGASPYTPYIDSDPERALLKYVGISTQNSSNPADYQWSLYDEYTRMINEHVLGDKVDINEYQNDRDEMFVSLGNKAGIDDLKSVEELANRIQADYEEFIKDGGKYNSDLQAIEDRIAAAVLNLENKVAQLNFINKYIRMGEEGLLIGDSTSLTKILMSDRRISFFDGGKEVAYMEGQEFRINRGTILESLQVGSHKLEQVDKNNTVFTFVR